MAKINWLQRRVGGPFSGQAARLIASGRKALEKLEPAVQSALHEHRALLARIVAAPRLDVDALYDLVHDVRGLAGTFGYASLGLIADGVARYITACREKSVEAHESALRVLTQALEQAFVRDEDGGATLADLTTVALALVRAKMPADAA